MFWMYEPTDGATRVYPHVPVTVEPGDIIEHDGEPAADGHWRECDDEPDADKVKQPDNSIPAVAPGHPDDELHRPFAERASGEPYVVHEQ